MEAEVKIYGLSFDEFIRRLEKFPESGIEDELAKISADWFKEGFPSSVRDNGGRKTDASKGGWKPRKKEYLYPALNKTGNLKKSIVGVKNEVKTDVYYASFHNDGTEKLPQRQFIGKSKELDNKCCDVIVKELTKYLNRL